MTELTTTNYSLAEVSTEQLRRDLAVQIGITAENVARLAEIWRELERRGEDLSNLRAGIGKYLSAVANGRLLPEAVVRLAGNTHALRAMALLDRSEQQRLLTDGSVSVLRDGDAVSVPVHRLTVTDISRAFDTTNGRVLPVSEQRAPRNRIKRSAPARRLVVPLTEAQHEAIQDEARRLNKSAAALALRILTDGGAFK